MNIDEIEQLVGIIKTSRISELKVTTGSDSPTTVRLRKALSVPAPVAHAPKSAATSKPAASAPAELVIKAPMVGIFHSLDDIAVVGNTIKTGQVVGSIESMKLMNDVRSKFDGVIAEVMAEDGMPVEYGHPLFRLEKV